MKAKLESPTPKKDWVKVGDRCRVVGGGQMEGVVKRIVPTSSTPYAVVTWSYGGSNGRHTITTLRKVES